MRPPLSNTTDHRNLIVTLPRGGPAPWPPDWDRAEAQRFVQTTIDQGVAGLVHRCVMDSGACRVWPDAVIASLSSHVRQQAALEALRRRELGSVLAGFLDSGIDCLLLKGTPLAYTLYASPELRPRGDTDILIPAGQRQAVESVLEGMEYLRAPMVSGERVMHQFAMHRTDRFDVRHVLDVHWKLTNPQVFADVLPFDELRARRVPVPALGPGAWTLSPVDALLYACIHRVAHHADQERLIWLWDIHCLLAKRSEEDWSEIIERVTEKRVGAVCLAGFVAAEAAFGACLPAGFAERLTAEIDHAAETPTRAYLTPGRRRIQHLWSDLRHLDWHGRFTLLKETVFPDAEYMRRHYGVSGRVPVILLYPYRIVTGVCRALRRPTGPPADHVE